MHSGTCSYPCIDDRYVAPLDSNREGSDVAHPHMIEALHIGCPHAVRMLLAEMVRADLAAPPATT
jgi:hypothetical protein